MPINSIGSIEAGSCESSLPRRNSTLSPALANYTKLHERITASSTALRRSTLDGSAGTISSEVTAVWKKRNPDQLINPFRPEDFAVQVTANRRRWIHVFPVDSTGKSKLAHHYVAGQSIVHIVGGPDEQKRHIVRKFEYFPL